MRGAGPINLRRSRLLGGQQTRVTLMPLHLDSHRSQLPKAAMFFAGAIAGAAIATLGGCGDDGVGPTPELFASTAALAAHETNTIHACAQDRTGDLRLVSGPDQCRPQETALQWNVQGPAGPTELADGAIKTRHLAPNVAGVSAAGYSFSVEDGEIHGSFNRFGAPPRVEMIDAGVTDRGGSFRQFRVTVPGLESAVAEGDVFLSGAVQAIGPVLATHQLRPDGSIDVFVWFEGGPEPEIGKIHDKIMLCMDNEVFVC